jgi:hypothetical protein
MNELEFQIKYKKLIEEYKKKKNGNAIWGDRITEQFKIWLYEKLNKDLRCEICGKTLANDYYMNAHLWWHKIYDIEYIEPP